LFFDPGRIKRGLVSQQELGIVLHEGRRYTLLIEKEWKDAEGNPMLALERGEKVLTPPALWFQAHGDLMHDYKDEGSSFPGNEPQRFVANYRKAGGEIDLIYFEGPRMAGHSPDLSKMGTNFDRMIEFVGVHMKAGQKAA
jgi:hypothetical protein